MTETLGLVLRPSTPEAVWLEAVALQDVSVRQIPNLATPGDPQAANCTEPWGPEVVELELEEQLPELPLTPD